MLKIDFQKTAGAHETIVNHILSYGQEVLPETVHHEDTKGRDDEFITKELIGYSFTIHDLSDLEVVLDSPFSKTNKAWAEQEFIDRIENYPNPGRALQHDPKWEKMLEKDGKYSYTYGERWAKCLPHLIQELKEHKNTRQAILTTWDSNLDQERLGKRRIPCTLSSQFLLRDGMLHQIYYIRSNDAIRIMPSDIYQMGMIQRWIANQIGSQVGFLQYITGSLHIYKRDKDLIKNVIGLDWK